MAKFNKTLVPPDGSSNSMRGLDKTIAIAKDGRSPVSTCFICMGGAKEAFLGSTSNYVMHKTKIPILVVK